eukprot:CAMPEP_0179445480 /NCGR_PEP_ID=MMETSP0799-20121207/28901_1 /TAXON_ID=46947 /ORGANISM="Geminigera cryophila, Strain CCMP2564" /LENGTH=57 /DNA_ID=CAMNT_0021233515 /DNA_START=21 /DNA_END=194 /DNA_ORIENTATION=+
MQGGQWGQPQSPMVSQQQSPMGQTMYQTPTQPQRALHEMTPEQVAQAGFDPSSVIGC